MAFLSTTRAAPVVTSRKTGVFSRVLGYMALHRQRHALARLDAKALQDIGLTEAEARAEAGRPIWDAPAHFYR